MKARVKKTGEVFEIASYATIPMECCDSFGEPLRFCFDEVEILSEGNDLKESDEPDYWTRLEHQYAGMAMQGLLANHYITDRIDVSVLITETASAIAHALVEKMKNIRKRFAKLKNRKEIMLGMGFPYDESSPIAYNEVVFLEWAKNNGKWEELCNVINFV